MDIRASSTKVLHTKRNRAVTAVCSNGHLVHILQWQDLKLSHPLTATAHMRRYITITCLSYTEYGFHISAGRAHTISCFDIISKLDQKNIQSKNLKWWVDFLQYFFFTSSTMRLYLLLSVCYSYIELQTYDIWDIIGIYYVCLIDILSKVFLLLPEMHGALMIMIIPSFVTAGSKEKERQCTVDRARFIDPRLKLFSNPSFSSPLHRSKLLIISS